MRYALQRRIAGRDGAHWRSVLYTDRKHILAVMKLAQRMAGLAVVAIELRVVEEAPDGAHRLMHSWTAATGWN